MTAERARGVVYIQLLLYLAEGVWSPYHLASSVKLILELVLHHQTNCLRFETTLRILARKISFESMRTSTFHFSEHFFSESNLFVFAEFSFWSVSCQFVPVGMLDINWSRLVLLDIGRLLEQTSFLLLRKREILYVVWILSYRHLV